MSIWQKAFWKAAAERAAKSAAQVVVLTFVGDQANVFSLDWVNIGGFALGGALLSLLTSVISSGVGNGGPSLTSVEKVVLEAGAHQ